MDIKKIPIITKHELLPLVAQYLPDKPVIVEAGAFNGRDTQLLASHWPNGTVHAFEPVPEIYQTLYDNTKDLPNVQCYQYALSNTTGTAQFHVSEKPEKPGKPFPAGSLHAPKERSKFSNVQYPKTINVQTMTLSDWAYEHNVPKIDFLWLDAQGHELAMLQGAHSLLQNVSTIYTEVHFIRAYEDAPLFTDVTSWLAENNFAMIARDFVDQEKWFFGNALYVPIEKSISSE